MGSLGSARRFGLLGTIVLVSGCGSDQFTPPPALKAMRTSEASGAAKTIYMVIAGPPDADLERCGLTAYQEAGFHQAIFRLSGPGPGDPPSKQGESIRRAVADGAEALIVVAADLPETADALAEVAEKGTVIVLYGTPMAAKPGRPPYILVAPEPFAKSARMIVDAALADARKNGRPGDGEALIFSDRKGDRFAAGRVAALQAAAEAAGCRKVEVIAYEGKPEDAFKGVLESAKKRPDLSIILADGDESMALAMETRRGMKGSPLSFVGGYAGVHGTFASAPYFDESAFVEFRPDSLARLAIRTALAKLSGEEVAPVVTQESRFNRGAGSTQFENPAGAIVPVGTPESSQGPAGPARPAK